MKKELIKGRGLPIYGFGFHCNYSSLVGSIFLGLRIRKFTKGNPGLLLQLPFVFGVLVKTIPMEPRIQVNMMDKILRQMEDVKNSQTSVLRKLTQIEVENINLNSELLSDALPGIHSEIDDAIQKLTALLETFKEQKIEFEAKHRPSEAA